MSLQTLSVKRSSAQNSHEVEFSLCCILEHLSKLLALPSAFDTTLIVNIFLVNFIAQLFRPAPQFPQLILDVLSFVKTRA